MATKRKVKAYKRSVFVNVMFCSFEIKGEGAVAAEAEIDHVVVDCCLVVGVYFLTCSLSLYLSQLDHTFG